MQKASIVLAKRVPESPLRDVAERSAIPDARKVFRADGDDLMSAVPARNRVESNRSRPETAGSAGELATWEGLARGDEGQI